MAYYNGFPVTYPQMYMPQPAVPYQQQAAQMMPQQMQSVPGTQMSQPNQPQMMTPPTIRAEIIQIEDEPAAEQFPLAAGASQMFITRAEDKIIIKSMGANGPLPLKVYVERPPAPPAPVFDPGEYVRKDELEQFVSAFLTAQTPTPTAKRSTKKEEAE